MRNNIRIVALVVAALGAMTAAEKKPLSNADVVKMVSAGLPDSTIILAIQNGPSAFDTSPEALIALKTGGVGATVIEAMLRGNDRPSDKTHPLPSESDVEKVLKKQAIQQSQGVISISSFKKLDGQRLAQSGVNLYKMDFESLIRFSEDCIWIHANIDTALNFQVARRTRSAKGGGWDEFLFVSQNPGLQVKRGTLFRVKGEAILEEKENGWNLARISRETIEVAGAAALAQVEVEKNAQRLGGVPTISQELLEKLTKEVIDTPKTPDQNFTSKNGKVSAVCPAGYKIEMGNTDIVGRFVAPEGGTLADSITVTCGTTPLFNRNQSLDEAVKQTIDSIRTSYRGAVVSESVRTNLAGVDAMTFVATVVEGALVKRKAITVAVRDKHVLGVVLHSTPEKFVESWKAYRRVCESYGLTVR